MLSLAKNAETLLLLITFKICEKKKKHLNNYATNK